MIEHHFCHIFVSLQINHDKSINKNRLQQANLPFLPSIADEPRGAEADPGLLVLTYFFLLQIADGLEKREVQLPNSS